MYPSDILASGRVAALSDLEELWYRRAIDLGWESGGMPAKPSDFAGWVGRGCTVAAARKLIKIFYEPHKKDAALVINPRQEKERQKFFKKQKQKSQAGKKGMASRWKQKTSGDNSVITEDNIPIPISIPIKEEEKREEAASPPAPDFESFEPSPYDHPAVVSYQERFQIKVGRNFAKEIAAKVSNLGVWSDLITEKIAIADEPLEKRKSIARWFLTAYFERLEKGKGKTIERLPTLEEKQADDAINAAAVIMPPITVGAVQ